MKTLFVPVLLFLFYLGNKVLSLPFILFFLFSFLGDASLALFNSPFFVKASGVFYFLSYVCLIGIAIYKFRFFKVDIVVGAYLALVFFISIYFLYLFYGFLKTVVPDNFAVFLFGIKGVALLILAFLAFGKYLHSDTKAAILFLMVAMCLVFSTVLNYVDLYYVHSWGFVMIESVVYTVGLYLLLNYVVEENKSTAIQKSTVNAFNRDNIFA
ncbi:hypothetical protein [Gelatiniphilus marinus]|uniref:Uncharacterized protein n=1 Tax=Gelatiniphilus marinus TaxID=1759464 RepID=A0ABW5JQ70_9FLAO